MTNQQSNQPLRVAIWAAVSSKPQAADDKISLADQEQSGREFAAAIGGHVVDVYQVPGHTRDIIFWQDAEATMDAYRELRQDCEARTFDVLYALDIDRLGRDPALSNQVISLVERSDAEVYLASAPHTVGQSTTAQRYIHAIQAVRAQEDQNLRIRRLAAGLRSRVRDKGLPASLWPIGYTPVPGPDGRAITAEFDPHTAPAVRLATDLFTSGQSYANILHALNASPYRPLRADRWGYSTVHRILNNDTYAGFPTWGDDTTPTEPSTAYPVFWEPPTHAAVLRERQRRAYHRYQKTAGSPYAGLVTCEMCGGPLVRHLHPNHRTYSLRCSTQTRKSVTGVPCHPNHIPESAITAKLEEFFADAIHNLDVLIPDDNRLHHLTAQLQTLETQITDLQRQRERLALALAAGQMDPQIYRTTDDQLLEQLADHHTNHDRITALIAATPDPQTRRARLLQLATTFSTRIHTDPAAEIRAELHNNNIHIIVLAGQITDIKILW